MSEQKKPVANDGPHIADLVIQDIKDRQAIGIDRYGTALQAFNGRNSTRDLLEEILDASQYCKQAIIEREEMVKVLKFYAAADIQEGKASELLKKLGEL